MIKSVFSVLRCLKCDTKATDQDNPEITYQERRDKYNSCEGWMCKCGYYNGLDK